ncbi:MAG: hypothetical protein ACXV7D_01460 [Thermoanaerobaculia bacterium]
MTRDLDSLLTIQRSLRSRFDDFRQAFQRANTTAMGVALRDFEDNFARWTEAGEQALLPALTRANIAGRDPRRELRLEYVQIRELTRFVMRGIAEGMPFRDLAGYVENLERRLRAHESEMAKVYYPAAVSALTEEEWATLEASAPLL